jgi:hypothetical protein
MPWRAAYNLLLGGVGQAVYACPMYDKRRERPTSYQSILTSSLPGIRDIAL